MSSVSVEPLLLVKMCAHQTAMVHAFWYQYESVFWRMVEKLQPKKIHETWLLMTENNEHTLKMPYIKLWQLYIHVQAKYVILI